MWTIHCYFPFIFTVNETQQGTNVTQRSTLNLYRQSSSNIVSKVYVGNLTGTHCWELLGLLHFQYYLTPVSKLAKSVNVSYTVYINVYIYIYIYHRCCMCNLKNFTASCLNFLGPSFASLWFFYFGYYLFTIDKRFTIYNLRVGSFSVNHSYVLYISIIISFSA